MSEPKIIKWVMSGPCEDALNGIDVPGHGACYGEYHETKTITGDILPAQRCPCTCHHWPEDGVPV